MKSVLYLALLVALVAANPTVEAFQYTFSDWFSGVFNLFILSVILPIYASLGYVLALFGNSGCLVLNLRKILQRHVLWGKLLKNAVPINRNFYP
jgi:hypothetical protein